MENNSIHPDEMDRLLRETFLNSPEAETDKVTDIMANHVYGSNWGIVPPADKAQQFVAKKLFFKGFSMNMMIGAVATVTSIAVGSGIYFSIPKKDKKVAEEIIHNKPTEVAVPVLIDSIAEQTPVIEITEKKVVIQKQELFPAEPEPQAPEYVISTTPQPMDTEKVKPNYINAVGSRPPTVKPIKYRYVVIPEISAMEAAANEKRKQEMIRQVQRFDKKEWAYIPMGTTHIDGKAVSVQAFFMQIHEVTNLQYRTFLYDLVLNDKLLEYEKAAVHDSAWFTKSRLELFVSEYFWNTAYDNYPVVNITYEGAKMYCDWLTRLVNNSNQLKAVDLINDIRIPMEEEWIYAAKADHDTTRYAWNGPYLRNSKGAFLANYQSSRELNDYDGIDVTSPVMSYYPNEWGLYNMCGNVAEMTKPAEDKMNVKGGAWNKPAEFLRIMHKYPLQLDDLPTTNVGFRVVTTYKGE